MDAEYTTIEASAPGRCGIIGNPSDIYGGTVVSCSISARATCRLELGQRNYSALEDPTLWRAALHRFPAVEESFQDVTPKWSTNIPRSSGLSGSSALLAATVACLAVAAKNETRTDKPLMFAELVRDIERHGAGIMCGYQDAYMVVCGGLNRLDFEGKTPALDSDPSHWRDGRRGPIGRVSPISAPLPFLLVTTGVERLSGSVHLPIAERWIRGEREVVRGIEQLAEFGRLGSEALKQQDWRSLAELMNENQEIVRGFGGSGEAIDGLIAACLRHGALAAKLAGAGKGGTVIALSEDSRELEQRLRKEGYTRFLVPASMPGLAVSAR